MRTLLVLPLLALWAPARAQERFTAEQRAARFYYDLGPKEVDTAAYPEKQRENYRVFAKTCSQCHTPARALNAPIVTREDWRRFIRRMYQRTKVSAGSSIDPKAAEAAIDFLAYDAQIRKVRDKAGFAARTQELRALFAEVRRERSRLQAEADKKKIREPAPYMGGR
ncbi:MAG: hypothetical protein HY403_11910 [Elusimicrobia bacterium]|nr:hypothetical protein [Elusimicrobiota bacterium]